MQVFRPRPPPAAIDLIARLLQYDPNARLTALGASRRLLRGVNAYVAGGAGACAHPYFDELREPWFRLPGGRRPPPLFNFTAIGALVWGLAPLSAKSLRLSGLCAHSRACAEFKGQGDLAGALIPPHARSELNWPPSVMAAEGWRDTPPPLRPLVAAADVGGEGGESDGEHDSTLLPAVVSRAGGASRRERPDRALGERAPRLSGGDTSASRGMTRSRSARHAHGASSSAAAVAAAVAAAGVVVTGVLLPDAFQPVRGAVAAPAGERGHGEGDFTEPAAPARRR